MALRCLSLLACWFVLLGCGDRGVPQDYGLCSDSVQRPGYYPQSIEAEIDILLVLDTSPAMQAHAGALARSLPRMVEALRTQRLKNLIPNVRIGVISADLGAGGYSAYGCKQGGDGARLQHNPLVAGCNPPVQPWITYTNGVTNIQYGSADPIERVKQALSCIGPLGASGCRFIQPLEAARRALDPKLNLNPGFIRKDAFLLVLFVSAGDD